MRQYDGQMMKRIEQDVSYQEGYQNGYRDGYLKALERLSTLTEPVKNVIYTINCNENKDCPYRELIKKQEE